VTEIILNTAEQKLAQYLARARYAANRKKNVENAKVGPQSDELTDLEGVAAEIAFCKHMNVFPDTQTEVHERADAYTVAMGGVDVKATKFRNGRLLARTTKKGKEADAYALMVGEFPTYRFVGWVTAEELLADENVTDLGHGPTYALPQHRLRGKIS
jgi:hypothetical protein